MHDNYCTFLTLQTTGFDPEAVQITQTSADQPAQPFQAAAAVASTMSPLSQNLLHSPVLPATHEQVGHCDNTFNIK